MGHEVGKLIPVAKIVRPHGIRGEVKVILVIETSEDVLIPRSFFLESEQGFGEWIKVLKARLGSQGYLTQLEGVEDRTHAESLRGYTLKLQKSDLPPIEGFHESELIGFEAQTVQGNKIGVVVDILETQAHPVFIIDSQGKEILIPDVESFVKDIDIEKGVILIDPIEGLLEDHAD